MSYNPSYKIYKPNNKDHTKGAASSWEFNPNSNLFFITIAKQNQAKDSSGNSTFSWKENSETFKLKLEEMAEISLVLGKNKPFLGQPDEGKKGKGAYHQTKNGNTIVKLYGYEDGFIVEMSSKKEGVLFWSGHRISQSEAEVIRQILDRCIIAIFSKVNA